jgi:hypothetical protein
MTLIYGIDLALWVAGAPFRTTRRGAVRPPFFAR